jgi:hypothetical protein
VAGGLAEKRPKVVWECASNQVDCGVAGNGDRRLIPEHDFEWTVGIPMQKG